MKKFAVFAAALLLGGCANYSADEDPLHPLTLREGSRVVLAPNCVTEIVTPDGESIADVGPTIGFTAVPDRYKRRLYLLAQSEEFQTNLVLSTVGPMGRLTSWNLPLAMGKMVADCQKSDLARYPLAQFGSRRDGAETRQP
jgi:hypothetical protein